MPFKPLFCALAYCRYSLLVDDSIVTNVSYEPEDTGLACLLCIERSKKAQHAKNSSKDDVGYKYL